MFHTTPRPYELTLAVVGLAHNNKDGSNRRFEMALCRPGEPVMLVPEPKNPVDPRAIAVLSDRGGQIGYLSAERCGLIGTRMAGGAEVQAIFQEATPTHALIRARFGGGAPTLPTYVREHGYRDDIDDGYDWGA